MSRTPGNWSFPIVRGSTWEDYYEFLNPDGTPRDMTGFHIRMYVRELHKFYGADEPPLMMLTDTGLDPALYWDASSPHILRSKVYGPAHAILNPGNRKKAMYGYWMEAYKDEAGKEYVLPELAGKITCHGSGGPR